MKAKLKEKILSSVLFYYFRIGVFFIKYRIMQVMLGDKFIIKRKYKKKFGEALNLKNPQTMTEKMQWLKLYDRKDYYTICADKFLVRNVIQKFGNDILVPIIFKTDDWREIKPENISEFPCIVKTNDGCGSYRIIYDKDSINWKKLRLDCRFWRKCNHYYKSQEWQYKNIKPCFIVERLLITKEGTIPEDYKLHFINGELKFIHCGVKSHNKNYKLTYDRDWKPLPFSWYRINVGDKYERGPEIEKPKTLNRMIQIGSEIAKDFPYVRVDFYDVDGMLYFGEITLCHGSGMNMFIPKSYDMFYGQMLKLPRLKKD